MLKDEEGIEGDTDINNKTNEIDEFIWMTSSYAPMIDITTVNTIDDIMNLSSFEYIVDCRDGERSNNKEIQGYYMLWNDEGIELWKKK